MLREQKIKEMFLAKNSEEFAQLLADVSANQTREIKCEGWELTEEDVLALADALQGNESVSRVYIYNSDLGEKGGAALFTALSSKSNLTSLGLNRAGISDDMAVRLADVYRNNPGITQIRLPNNNIKDKGLVAIMEAIRGRNNMTVIQFDESIFSSKGYKVAEDVIIDGGMKNLYPAKGINKKIENYATDNMWVLKQLWRDMGEEECREMTPLKLQQIYERLPGIYITNANEDKEGVRVSEFQGYIETLPTLTADNFSYGTFVKRNETGKAPIDNPRMWDRLPVILEKQNERGVYFRGRDLISKDGRSPKESLVKAAERGKLGVFFAEKNWEGASPEELKAVMRVLSPEMREQIPNRHSLTATVNQTAPQMHHLR